MPTIDSRTHHITVRHSPQKAGHCEVTITGPDLAVLNMDNGAVLTRRELPDSHWAVQLQLDRDTAMILSSMLQQIAYDLPFTPEDDANTVWVTSSDKPPPPERKIVDVHLP
jgi:hypothetical protein